MGFNPDPGVTDAEETNFIARLEDRYAQGDMTGPNISRQPWRGTPVDVLGYGRWSNSYFVKRQSGQDHETATQNVLTEIQNIVHPPPVPPFNPAPKYWRGNMCGVRIPGLPAVPGGSSDTSLFLSWFYHLYNATDRATCRQVWVDKHLTHWKLSWPDAQNVGVTPQQFLAFCQELESNGFHTCVMLSAKPTSSAGVRTIQQTLANIMLVLPLLLDTVPMFCPAWEASFWMSPEDLQFLINAIAPLVVPKSRLYVHFQPGYFAYQPNGQQTGAFWQANIGKLTGVLHQRDPNEDKGAMPEYVARITDCLQRFNGADNCPADSGLGGPFDFVADEITASEQFSGSMTEAQGDAWGQAAINTPPSGKVSVQGSGNGL